MPIVFLDTPGDAYWEAVDEFVEHAARRPRARLAADRSLYRITDSSDAAVEEIERFYANYHSVRYRRRRPRRSGMHHGPTDAQLADLNATFRPPRRRRGRSGASSRTGSSAARTTISISTASPSSFDRHGYAVAARHDRRHQRLD